MCSWGAGRTHTLDDGFEVLAVPLLVAVRNGADLVVVSRAENAAQQQLVRAHPALGRLVDL